MTRLISISLESDLLGTGSIFPDFASSIRATGCE